MNGSASWVYQTSTVLTLVMNLTVDTKLQNIKSHDHHVFMEALLPIAFSALQADVLEPF